MTAGDLLQLSVIVFGAGIIIIAIVSSVLNFFLALNSPPSIRAAWTVGIAYLAAAILFIFAVPPGYAIIAPLGPLPGAVLAYWFWRNDYRRRWFESAEDLPDGIDPEEDEWTAGLLRLLLAIIAATGAALLKWGSDAAF